VREEVRAVIKIIQIRGNEDFNLGSADEKTYIDVSPVAVELTGLGD
jgi:hypothetical protein